MKIQTYAIYDTKARCFSQPFYAPNDEVALRMFQITAGDPGSNLSKFPADFSLHHLAEYDDEIASFTQTQPRPLGLASQFITKE
ncbi:MAG: nonstructural protein [Arizlama microvirus]|nr:MAG: nonstructural protein [Arizlama microvirus]